MNKISLCREILYLMWDVEPKRLCTISSLGVTANKNWVEDDCNKAFYELISITD